MARVKIDIPDTFMFRTEIPVRITDINYGGHLGNDSLLTIFHEARMQFLKHFGQSEKDFYDCGLIMSDAAIQYKSEAFYGDTLTIYISPGDFTNSGFDLVSLVINKKTENEVARLKTGMVCFDYKNKTLAKLPEQVKISFNQK
jgi:acyl-CoA thioester hydrolase